MDSTLVPTWTFDYFCFKFWEEFKAEGTVDSLCERNFLQGFLRQKIESTEQRGKLVDCMQLIVCLADGREVDIRYNSEQEDTPLENALCCYDKVMAGFESPGDEVEAVRDMLKLQAVLVCCKKEDYCLAMTVFQRVWGQISQDTPISQQNMHRRLKSFIDEKKVGTRFVNQHTYEKFLNSAINPLQKVFDGFNTPFLIMVQRKYEKQRAEMMAGDNDESSCHSSMEQSSSIVEDRPLSQTSSPLKGLRHLRRMSNKLHVHVPTQLHLDGDNGSMDEVGCGQHCNQGGDSSRGKGIKRKLPSERKKGGRPCTAEMLQSALVLLQEEPEEMLHKTQNEATQQNGATQQKGATQQNGDAQHSLWTRKRPNSQTLTSTSKSLPAKTSNPAQRTRKNPTPSPQPPTSRPSYDHNLPSVTHHKQLQAGKPQPKTTVGNGESSASKSQNRHVTRSDKAEFGESATRSSGITNRVRSSPRTFKGQRSEGRPPSVADGDQSPSTPPATRGDGSKQKPPAARVESPGMSTGTEGDDSASLDSLESSPERPQKKKTNSTPRRGKSIHDQKYQPNRNAQTGLNKPSTSHGDTSNLSDSNSDSSDTRPVLVSPKMRNSLDPSTWQGNHSVWQGNRSNHKLRKTSVPKKPWTEKEVNRLKEALRRYGPGKWSEMILRYDFDGRTNVNLKDKWRNMVKNGEI